MPSTHRSIPFGKLTVFIRINVWRILVLSLVAVMAAFGTLTVARASGPVITALKTYVLFNDADSNGVASPGDTLRYTVAIQNSGTAAATGVSLNDVIDANTTLVGGSVDVSPLAIDDTYDTIGNTLLDVSNSAPASPVVHVAGSLFDNDVEFLGDTFDAAHTHITSHVAPSHGTLTLDNNAGTFTYLPTAGFTGTDTFTYTLTDTAGLSDTATVTINVTSRVWYVKNNASGDNSGRSTGPFTALASAQTASSANDTIYVYPGDGTTTSQNAGIVLKAGQRLIGAGVALTVPVSVNGGSNPTTLLPVGTAPLIGNSAGIGVSVPDVSGVQIFGLNIAGSTNAVNATTTATNSGGFELADDTISAAGANGLDVNSGGTGSLTVNVHDNSITATGNGIDVSRTAGTVNIVGFANNVITGNTAGSGINIVGPNVVFDAVPGGSFQTVSGGTTAIGASANGVGASGMVLTGVSGDLAFTDLDIFNSSGAGLRASGTAVYNGATGVGFQIGVSAGVATVSSAGGPAVDLSTVTANTLAFFSITSTGSSTTGVALNSLLGTFSAGSSSSISGSTGTGFQVGSSNATITYDGTLTTTTGKGVDLTTNTGSTISFTGALSLSSGSNTAFNATSSGTVSATSTTSTLTSTTATALNVANTTIGAGGLKFKSISAGTAASGPASGIVLNNTGASGGLVVLGNSGAGTGGTIQKTTTAGISLTSVGGSVSLTDMNITTGTHDGIRGSSVANFALISGSVTNNGTVAADNGIHITDASGTVALTNTSVTGSFGDNVDFDSTVSSSAVITNFTVTNGAYSNSANGSGLLVQLKNTAVIQTGSVTGLTLNANASYAIDVVTNDNSTIGNGAGAPATGTFTMANNTITNDGGVGVSFASGGGTGASNMYVRFVGNVMTGTHSHAINVVSGATSTGGTQKVLIDNNCVGMSGAVVGTGVGHCGLTAGAANSGSTLGEGIQVTQQGKTLGTVTITNNVIRNLGDGVGGFGNRVIDVQTLGPTATGQAATPFDVKIVGNNVDSGYTGTFPQAAIYLGVDDQGSPTTMHAEIHGNTVPSGAGCEGNSCTGSTGMIFYDEVTTPSTGTLFNFSGSGLDVSSEIANTNTGTAGKTCAVDLAHLTLTGTAPATVAFAPATEALAALPQITTGQSVAQAAQSNIANAMSTNASAVDTVAVLSAPQANFKQASWLAPQSAPVAALVSLHSQVAGGGNNPQVSAVQHAPLQSGETVNVSIGTLPAGKTVTVRFDVTIDNPLVPPSTSQVSNQGTVSYDPTQSVQTDDPGVVGSSDPTITLIPHPDLTVVKSNNVSGTATLAGGWTWKLHVANGGGLGAAFTNGQTLLTDNLPNSGLTYGSPSVSGVTNVTNSANLSCAIASNTLNCTASGATVTVGATTGAFDVQFTVTPSVTGIYANPRAAGVCSVDPNDTIIEGNEANNSCSDTVTVTAPDLSVTKTNDVSSLTSPGSSWNWTLSTSNSGNGGAAFTTGQTILKDDLPSSGLTYGSPSVSNVTNVTNSGNISCSISTNTLTCTASGATVTVGATTGHFDVVVPVSLATAGVFANPRAAGTCAVDPNSNVSESNEANNTCSDTVTVISPPSITKSFDNATMAIGDSNTLNFQVQNPNGSLALNGVAFTDTLPAGLLVDTPNGLTGSCGGGTITATPASSSISLSGATLAGGASCSFSVSVTATSAGVKNNSVSVTSTNAGAGNTSNASVTVVGPADLSKSFGASSIVLNASTSLSFTVQNNNTTQSLSGIGFTDTLPAGLVISTPNGLTGSCGGGSIVATAGTGSISLSAATLASSSSCTFSVDVDGTSAGTKVNTTSAITSTEGGSGSPATDSIDVIAPPAIVKAFGVSGIALNGTTSLTFTLSNPAANPVSLTGVAFTDTLPSGLVVATPGNQSSTCSGTATAPDGSTSVSLSGATLASGASCTVSVDVEGTTEGAKINSVTVTSTNGGTGNTSSDTVTVAVPPSITKSFGVAAIGLNGTTSLSFQIDNPGSATTLTGISFTDSLPAGLVISTPNGLTGSCGGGTITATAASGSVSLSGATLAAGASCTFSVNVKGTTGGVKNNSVSVTSNEGGPGNTSNASLTVDATAPVTTIDTNPSDPTTSTSATFTFSGTDNVTPSGSLTFECKLDAGAFAACTSPKTYTGLADGSHTFQVRATDQFGNVEAPPASFTWVVDTTPPDTTITANPSNPSNSTSASFSFTGSDTGGSGVASFKCQLDGGGFSACTSPQNYSGLSAASHTFQVEAIDNVGLVDPSPASFTWTIDTTRPSVTINQAAGQSDTTNVSPVHFTAVFSEAVTGFDGTDVSLTGTANPASATVTEIAPNNGTTYDVAVGGMTGDGTITVSIPDGTTLGAGAPMDAAGNVNFASTTTTPGDTDTITNYTFEAPPVITEGDNVTVNMSENSSPTAFALTLHATDANSDPLTWSISAPPNYGSASAAPGPATSSAISYTPLPNYYGTDTFTVQVSDGTMTDSITVHVNIAQGSNPGPLIFSQSYLIQYDTWVGVTDPSAFNGGLRKAMSGQFKFVVPVATNKIILLTYRGPDQGKAQILVDGAVKATVNLYNATPQWQYPITVTGLSMKKHIVIVKALNTHVSPSTGNWVAVDAFQINGSKYDDSMVRTSGMFTYGSWVGDLSPHARFGSYRLSSTANATLAFAFDGVQFNWVTARSSAYGKAAIYVDNVLVQTVDLYKSGAAQWQYRVTVGGFAYGHHNVRIVVLGTKNAHSTGTGIVCDGFEIQ